MSEMFRSGLYYNDEDSIKDGYPQFEEGVRQTFAKAVSGDKKLFTTNVEDLYELYLANLPEKKAGLRQHYTCHACRQFIQRFGGIVTIDEYGNKHSAMWDVDNTPEFFKPVVEEMKEVVLRATANGVFVPDARVLGTPKTGEWTHLSVPMPSTMVNKSLIRNSFQLTAEKRESFRVLSRAIQEYTPATVDNALALLESETMYRADRIIGPARWFKSFIQSIEGKTTEQKRNLMWAAVATQPDAHVKFRSGMLGSLFSDIAEGLSARVVSTRFAEKMGNYQRSQTGPSANAIYEAEKIVDKLGIAESLQRRFAKEDDIPNDAYVWQTKGEIAPIQQQEKTPGVFGHIKPKEQTTVKSGGLDIPAKLMTFEKFKNTVLPTADAIELLVDDPNRFMALVTALNPLAPNILQWENKLSWYYHGGIDGETKRRVEEAGGRYENNEIRVSLIWDGYTDLDIHCITPGGTRQRIYYGNKKVGTGWLDVDANGGRAQTQSPVENIRWADNAPEGQYRFFVHNYSQRGKGPVPFRVELEINGQVYTYSGEAGSTGWQQDVFAFNYVKGQQPAINAPSHGADNGWGVDTNSFVKVKGIITSPNLWGDEPKKAIGTHIFFLLEGVQDLSEGKGRGFFNETLKPELREIRRTLEAYTANTPIQGADEATACGVGYSKDNEWNVTLRVTSGGSTRMIKIDRWD